MMDVMAKVLPIDWTVVVQGGNGTTAKLPIYENPDWAKGFDLVVHNECSADVDDDAFVRRITEPHRAGRIPAMVIHCSMHSYRALTTDPWREFLGVTSRRHTRAHNVAVKFTAKDHPAVQGLPDTWSTPTDELYVIEKLWPGTQALATAVSPEDQQEYPVAWAHDFGGARVFGTTLGHGNETWNDPVFQDLLRRGLPVGGWRPEVTEGQETVHTELRRTVSAAGHPVSAVRRATLRTATAQPRSSTACPRRSPGRRGRSRR